MISTGMYELIILLFFLMMSAFFNGSEASLFSLKKSELLKFSSSSSKKDVLISEIMERPQKILITILLGSLFANVIMSALSTRILLGIWGEYGHFIAIMILTPVIIILSEILPKTIAINQPKKISRIIITFLYYTNKLFYPLTRILLVITNSVIKLFNLRFDHDERMTEDELNVAIRLGESNGIINNEDVRFLNNVLRFSKKEAQNIMIPRNQAVFISYNAGIDEAAQIFLKTGWVRTVVYKNDFDNIVGVLDSRELIPYRWGYKKAKTIQRLMYSVHHYPATKELGELLTDFLRKKIQIAVVVDEYGGTAGLVTLPAILYELLGREFSLWDDVNRSEIRKIDDKTSIIDGDMQIDDFCFSFDEKISSSESETIGGYIIEKLGHFPKRSEIIETEKYLLRIKKIIKNRIDTIEVTVR